MMSETMTETFNLGRLVEVWRYYQAGAINIAFGYSLYALLVWLGINIYAAQILSHILGMGFNYFTYSRHAFRNSNPAKLRFVLAYGVNYVMSAAMLFVVIGWLPSAYAAGFLVTLFVSLINYFALKHLVFKQGVSK
jgi:putative flippase GtrA